EFRPMMVTNARGERIKFEDWDAMSEEQRDAFAITKGHWLLPIKNFGQVPAENIQIRLIPQIGLKPTRQQINSTEFGDPFVLMPRNIYPIIFSPPLETFFVLLDRRIRTYATIEIKYNSANSKTERLYGIVLERTPVGFNVVKSW